MSRESGSCCQEKKSISNKSNQIKNDVCLTVTVIFVCAKGLYILFLFTGAVFNHVGDLEYCQKKVSGMFQSIHRHACQLKGQKTPPILLSLTNSNLG